MSIPTSQFRFMITPKSNEEITIKLKIISCKVMSHELRYCASRSPHRIDTEFLYQGLHEFPSRLQQNVQDALDRIDDDEAYDYILLNYGLCGNGTLDISYSKRPLIMHNVQDCIPLLLGDEKIHKDYTGKRPGTFWFSVGWIEGFPLPGSPDYADRYTEFYGREISASKRDVIESLLMENYTHLTYIQWDELGEKVNRYGRDYTKRCVRSMNERLGMHLQYDQVSGDSSRLQSFVDGEWDGEDFILLEPGQRLGFNAGECRLFAR